MPTLVQQLKRTKEVLASETATIRDIVAAACNRDGLYIQEVPDAPDFFVLVAGPRRSYVVKIMPQQDTYDDIAQGVREGMYSTK